MKSKHLNLVWAVMLLLFSNTLTAQDNFFKVIADATENTFTIEPYVAQNLDNAESNELFGISEEFRESYALEPHDPDAARVLAATFLALGVGLGFGGDDFLYCLHAAYYLKLATLGKSFFYGALGLAYSGLSGNLFNRSLLEFQLRFLMFTPITQFNQVYFMYGLLLAYGFGADKFDIGGQTDFTNLTAALTVGFTIILTASISLMMHTNVLAHLRQTFEPEGSSVKIKQNDTFGFINKNNIFALALLFNL